MPRVVRSKSHPPIHGYVADVGDCAPEYDVESDEKRIKCHDDGVISFSRLIMVA